MTGGGTHSNQVGTSSGRKAELMQPIQKKGVTESSDVARRNSSFLNVVTTIQPALGIRKEERCAWYSH